MKVEQLTSTCRVLKMESCVQGGYKPRMEGRGRGGGESPTFARIHTTRTLGWGGRVALTKKEPEFLREMPRFSLTQPNEGVRIM